jgi:aspartate ammonia-lyase
MFSRRCIQGIIVDKFRCSQLVEHSLITVTALVPHIGYEKATQVARQAAASGRTIQEEVLAMELLTLAQLEIILDPLTLTRPGIAGDKIIKTPVPEKPGE